MINEPNAFLPKQVEFLVLFVNQIRFQEPEILVFLSFGRNSFGTFCQCHVDLADSFFLRVNLVSRTYFQTNQSDAVAVNLDPNRWRRLSQLSSHVPMGLSRNRIRTNKQYERFGNRLLLLFGIGLRSEDSIVQHRLRTHEKSRGENGAKKTHREKQRTGESGREIIGDVGLEPYPKRL